MSIRYMGSVAAAGTANAATTAGVDTTGATLIVAISAYDISVPVITDSKGNTWTKIIDTGGPVNKQVAMFYTVPSSVGAGHTFTSTLFAQQPSICVSYFSGAFASPPLDQFNKNSGTTTTPTTGNVIPAYFGELIIAAIGHNWGATISGVSGPFTIGATAAPVVGVSTGGCIASVVQASAAPKNPTWTLSAAVASSGAIASFRAADSTIAPAIEDAGAKAVAVGYPGQTYLSTLDEHVQAENQSLYAQLEGWLGTDHNPDGTHAAVRATRVTSTDGFAMTTWPTTAVASNAYVTDGGYVSRSTSSLRFKTDVQPVALDEARRVIMAMESVTYRGANVNHDDFRRHPGFIAEDVVRAEPLLVTFDTHGRPDYVTYDRVPVYLTRVVQDHDTRLDDLERKLTEAMRVIEKLSVK